MKNLKHYAIAVVAAVLFSACGTTRTVPLTGRKQNLMISDQEVLSLSSQEYTKYMQGAKKSADATNTAMVQRVGQKLANAVQNYLTNNGYANELQNYAWEFNLTQDNQLNAFCMPGGKIVVYSGMLNLIGNGADRDDELAAVIGHEVGHAIAKHGQERASQQLLQQLGGQLLGAAVAGKTAETQQAVALAYGMGAQYGALLPFSRKHEAEADYMGLALMTMAGYDPDSAPAFWRKMAAAGSGKTPELLSSHPSDASRVAALQKALPEIKAKYKP